MGGDLTVWLTLVPISALLGILALVFALGAAPVFFIRLITLFYPSGDPRRAELIAEMTHIKGVGKTLDRFHWLGEAFATAAAEGTVARREARRRRRTRTVAVAVNEVKDVELKAGQSVFMDVSGEGTKWQEVPQDEFERILARVNIKLRNVDAQFYLPED